MQHGTNGVTTPGERRYGESGTAESGAFTGDFRSGGKSRSASAIAQKPGEARIAMIGENGGQGSGMQTTAPERAGRVDWRGMAWYLAICFGVTWLVEIGALARGVRFARLTPGSTLMLALVMLVPAASAWLVRGCGWGMAGRTCGSGWACSAWWGLFIF